MTMYIAREKNEELKDRILNSPSKNENAYHLSGKQFDNCIQVLNTYL